MTEKQVRIGVTVRITGVHLAEGEPSLLVNDVEFARNQKIDVELGFEVPKELEFGEEIETTSGQLTTFDRRSFWDRIWQRDYERRAYRHPSVSSPRATGRGAG